MNHANKVKDQCHVVGRQVHTTNYMHTKFGHPNIYTFRDIKLSKKFTPPPPPESNTYVSLSRRNVAGETKTKVQH